MHEREKNTSKIKSGRVFCRSVEKKIRILDPGIRMGEKKLGGLCRTITKCTDLMGKWKKLDGFKLRKDLFGGIIMFLTSFVDLFSSGHEQFSRQESFRTTSISRTIFTDVEKANAKAITALGAFFTPQVEIAQLCCPTFASRTQRDVPVCRTKELSRSKSTRLFYSRPVSQKRQQQV